MIKHILKNLQVAGVVLVAVVVLGCCEVLEAKEKAILFGNDQFENLPQLKGACADVDALADVLRAGGKFDVVVLKNLTRADFLESLQKFNEEQKEGESVLFAFITHGYTLQGESCLTFVDTQVNEQGEPTAESTVKADEIVAWAQRTNDGCCAFIFDVCRNGQQTSVVKLTNPARLLKKTIIMNSCPLGESSYEDDKSDRGVFMLRFCEALRGSADYAVGDCDGFVSLFEAFQFCFKEASNEKETPTLEGSLDAGSSLILTKSSLSDDESEELLRKRGVVSLETLERAKEEAERAKEEAERQCQEQIAAAKKSDNETRPQGPIARIFQRISDRRKCCDATNVCATSRSTTAVTDQEQRVCKPVDQENQSTWRLNPRIRVN